MTTSHIMKTAVCVAAVVLVAAYAPSGRSVDEGCFHCGNGSSVGCELEGYHKDRAFFGVNTFSANNEFHPVCIEHVCTWWGHWDYGQIQHDDLASNAAEELARREQQELVSRLRLAVADADMTELTALVTNESTVRLNFARHAVQVMGEGAAVVAHARVSDETIDRILGR